MSNSSHATKVLVPLFRDEPKLISSFFLMQLPESSIVMSGSVIDE